MTTDFLCMDKRHFSKYLLFCSTEERKSYWFRSNYPFTSPVSNKSETKQLNTISARLQL